MGALAGLKAAGLRKTFHPGSADERIALDGVDLTLSPGDFAVVIGSNGAGKSTLLNALAGEVALDAGSVSIGDDDVTRLATHRRARWISRVFQDPLIGTAATMTIEENLAVSESRGDTRTLASALSRSGRERYVRLLADLGLGLESRLGTKVSMLSGGQRQALALLMAVMKRPALLLLDEHTAALDPRTAEAVMNATLAAISGAQLTTLMVTHNMTHALRFGNRLLMMHAGRIVLDVTGENKSQLTVEGLVEKFHLVDDKMLLA
ncbi:MAG: ATP-binding cassette domain-containing protein [Betaproteobacteria bacterium]|nr:ATP-binding cassette domain-containing protein [Betaproteobacteria bacterium]